MLISLLKRFTYKYSISVEIQLKIAFKISVNENQYRDKVSKLRLEGNYFCGEKVYLINYFQRHYTVKII